MAFAKIRLSSKGTAPFSSGSAGGFGIPLSQKQDTLSVVLDGYHSLKILVAADQFQSITLMPLDAMLNAQASGLMSVTKTVSHNKARAVTSYGGETYTSSVENDFVGAAEAPETSIALHINCASYSNIRRFINMDAVVPPDGVRIDEMLNYFNLNEANADSAADSFVLHTKLTSCPWNASDDLLFVTLRAPKLNYQNIPPAKFTFLIDVSGSMDKDNRLPLVQAAFKFLVNNLRAADTVGIVTYGGYVGIALPPTSGAEKEKIISVIDGLHADGDTPGSQAIQTAYEMAEKIFNAASNNRVILATDGDFNIGQTSDKELENIVNQHKQTGIYLTCLGAGMGNYKDSRLELLAKKGNGNFAYLDNLQEAQKTMVTEFTKNMYTVANDATLDVHFNDKPVKKYRLIGYDNQKDQVKDTSLMEGGEIGSGQGTMIIFEIERDTLNQEAVANVALHYRLPQSKATVTKTITANNRFEDVNSVDAQYRFGAAVGLFGMMLKHSKYASSCTWEMIERLARSTYDPNNISQKEFVALIEKAKNIYQNNTDDKRKRR